MRSLPPIITLVWLIFGFCIESNIRAGTYNFVPYPVNLKPMEKYQDLLKIWQKQELDYANSVMPENLLKIRLEIIEKMSKSEERWVDGYWMVAEAAFQLGASYTDEKDRRYARQIFVKGEDAAEKCLKIDPNHPICKLLLGAMIGKIASLDGIYSAVKKAERLEQLWLDVIRSKYNYNLGRGLSMQGSARYALGMFYRLVPDFFLVKWLFGVRGDIKKSIEYHREALAIDSPTSCGKIMLAASLFCSVSGDLKTSEGQEAMRHLREGKHLPAKNLVTKACQNDIEKIEKDPGIACGYETARQQENSAEDFKKRQENSEQATSH